MAIPASHQVMQLFLAWSESNQGNQAALEQLMPLVYAELRRENRAHFFAIAAA